MNKFCKGILLAFFCLILTGGHAFADKLEEISKRLEQLQDQVKALENIKQEMELLKETIRRETEAKDEQIASLEEQMEEVRPVFDLANTLSKTNMGGYFELHYNSEVDEKNTGKLDFHRFIYYLDH